VARINIIWSKIGFKSCHSYVQKLMAPSILAAMIFCHGIGPINVE